MQDRNGRKRIERLRDAFQDRVDGIEKTSAARLDRLVQQGSREFEEFREDFERRRRNSRSCRSGRRSSRKGRRHRRGKRTERRERDSAEIEHRRMVRRARSRANRRIGFLSHFGSYVATLAIILVASRSVRAVMIVALAWGVGIFIHYLAVIAAPRLRDHWVREEVGARSPRAVASERQKGETRSRRSMEDLSASIAHEIRNPITAAKSLVEQMGEDPSSSENIRYADIALAELDRVERSISHLLRYARDEEPTFERLAIEATARAAVNGMRERARAGDVDLRVDFDRVGEIRGDPEKLRRVFGNLISNALDAIDSDPGERPRIEILGGENLAGNEVWIRVIDNGPGIPAEDRERIWSPFYTTKKTGTGLGLALTRKTIEAHGGRIDLEPGPEGRGSEFVISFPRLVESGDISLEEAGHDR